MVISDAGRIGIPLRLITLTAAVRFRPLPPRKEFVMGGRTKSISKRKKKAEKRKWRRMNAVGRKYMKRLERERERNQ